MTNFFYTDMVDCAGSTNLDRIFYNKNTNELCVEFLSGSVVGYASVPYDKWLGFKAASSYGRYYNANIRHRYKGLGKDFDNFVRQHVPETPKTDFIVKGLIPATRTIRAATMQEAIDKFLAEIPGATVTEVSVKFS